jgi:hypothetical protein|tara:strand:- start:11322 stop:11468 length:147 start_codon:yes stop_codon:yes gene_type:complete
MTNFKEQLSKIRPSVVKNTQVNQLFNRQAVDAKFIVRYEGKKIAADRT